MITLSEDDFRTPLSTRLLSQVQRLRSNHLLTPATLMKKLDDTWIPALHLQKVSQIFASAISQGGARLLISFPPRHGKSKLLTQGGATWFIENFPGKAVVLASYGAALSTGFSRDIRDSFISNPKLFKTKVRDDVSNVNDWQTTVGGRCIAVGIGGALTGKGADLLIIDDYIKDLIEASNPQTLEDIYDWFKAVAYTRLAPNASIAVIATRWAKDDLIGRILQDDAEKNKWTYVDFPALCIDEETDVLGRKEGEVLFPERFTPEMISDIKETLGSHFFDALYQQRPRDKESLNVNRRWFEIVDTIPFIDRLKKVRTWDLAASEKKGDWTAGPLGMYDPVSKIYYIADMQRARRGTGGVETLLQETAYDDGSSVPIHIEQEPGSSGKMVIEIFRKTTLSGFTVKGERGNGSKTVRAQAMIAAAEFGRVKLLRGSWNKAFLDEIEEFPRGKHDDQVDAVASGYNILVSPGIISATWGRKRKKYSENTETSGYTDVDQESSNNYKNSGRSVTFGRRGRY